MENIFENIRKPLAFGIGQDLHAAETRALGDADAMKTHAAKHSDDTDRSRLNSDRSRSGSRDETQIATGTTGTGGSGISGGSVSGVSGVSEPLKSSHWTRQCEGYGSQASRSTEDIEKEHSVDSALDEESLEVLKVRFEISQRGRREENKKDIPAGPCGGADVCDFCEAFPENKDRTYIPLSFETSYTQYTQYTQYTVIQLGLRSSANSYQFTFLDCAGSTAPARFET